MFLIVHIFDPVPPSRLVTFAVRGVRLGTSLGRMVFHEEPSVSRGIRRSIRDA